MPSSDEQLEVYVDRSLGSTVVPAALRALGVVAHTELEVKIGGQVFFVPPARLPVIAHIEHGYSGRKTASHFDCSDTTVHRCVHAGIDGRQRSLKLERKRPDPSLHKPDGPRRSGVVSAGDGRRRGR